MIKFGTDGWRAIIDEDFNAENVALAAQAIAQYLIDNQKKSLVIGFDFRHQADAFSRLASEVLAANNIKVYLVDKACPTPATGWSIIDKKSDGAIMFTASHNPAEFLGLKFMTDEAMVAPSAVTDEFMKNLETLEPSSVKKMDFEAAVEQNLIEVYDPKPSYFAKIKTLVDLDKIKASNLKVLVNPMYGAGIGYLAELLMGGNLQVATVNNNPDPDFGGLLPEPIVEENVRDAMEKVKKEKFDICLSCDGDADRIGLIDENGRMITSLEAFLLLVYYFTVVKRQTGSIVRTLSNTIMADHLGEKIGFPVFETKVGFKYVGEKMKETQAIFGGEESGGSAVSNFMLVRDAQIMNIFILDLMVSLQKPISKILALVEEAAGGAYQFRRLDVEYEYNDYETIKNKKAPELAANPPKEILGKKVVKTRTDDGLKMYFEDDSWLLIRFSGTEPVLRLYAEAKSITEVDQLIGYAKDYFQK